PPETGSSIRIARAGLPRTLFPGHRREDREWAYRTPPARPSVPHHRTGWGRAWRIPGRCERRGIGGTHFPLRCVSDLHVEHSGRCAIGEGATEKRHRHVVDPGAARRRALRLASMRVTVEHERHRISPDWLFETARAQEWIDFRRLAVDGPLNR